MRDALCFFQQFLILAIYYSSDYLPCPGRPWRMQKT